MTAFAIVTLVLAVVVVPALTLAPLLRRARGVAAQAEAEAADGVRSGHVRGLGLGAEDAMAWEVRDLAGWIAALRGER